MCREVQCPKCGRPTWAGCGAHIEATLAHVPREARCQCQVAPQAPAVAGGKKQP